MSVYTRWYRDGNVTVNKGSNVVTGTKTYWETAGIHAGDIFKVGGIDYEISEVTSDTSITLAENARASCSNAGYAVIRNFTANTSTEVAARVIELLGKFTKYIDTDMQTLQGKSAYDLAVEMGFTGTLAQWLETLKAAQEWTALDTRTSILTYENSGLHNSICRGKNLGEAPTPEQMAAIRAGTFNDLWLGDYWQKGKNLFRIAHFNYYVGDDVDAQNPLRSKNHVVVVSDGRLFDMDGNEQFANWETIAEGGYIATPHNEFIQTTGLEILKSLFGEENLAAHPRSTSNAIAEHNVTSYVVQQVIADAVCAQQFFGYNPLINDYDTFNTDRFALAGIEPVFLYRKWGRKQLRNLGANNGTVCRCDYGKLNLGAPNEQTARELFVMCCLG